MHLLPTYVPRLKCMPVKKCTFKVWDDISCERLRSCFDCTDWSIFYNCSMDLDEITDTITQYVLFCESLCIPTKTVKCFPNNKPWVTKDLKEVINEKKRLFSEKNKAQLKICQKKLDKKLEHGRQVYRDKINDSFYKNNSKDVWDKIKQIIGSNEKIYRYVFRKWPAICK